MNGRIILLISVFLCPFACATPSKTQIVGVWESIDKSKQPITITFTEEGDYWLAIDDKIVTGRGEEPVKYQIRNTHPLEIYLSGKRSGVKIGKLEGRLTSEGILDLTYIYNNRKMGDRMRLLRVADSTF